MRGASGGPVWGGSAAEAYTPPAAPLPNSAARGCQATCSTPQPRAGALISESWPWGLYDLSPTKERAGGPQGHLPLPSYKDREIGG